MLHSHNFIHLRRLGPTGLLDGLADRFPTDDGQDIGFRVIANRRVDDMWRRGGSKSAESYSPNDAGSTSVDSHMDLPERPEPPSLSRGPSLRDRMDLDARPNMYPSRTRKSHDGRTDSPSEDRPSFESRLSEPASRQWGSQSRTFGEQHNDKQRRPLNIDGISSPMVENPETSIPTSTSQRSDLEVSNTGSLLQRMSLPQTIPEARPESPQGTLKDRLLVTPSPVNGEVDVEFEGGVTIGEEGAPSLTGGRGRGSGKKRAGTRGGRRGGGGGRARGGA